MFYYKCPVCESPSIQDSERDWQKINCFRCGRFRADDKSLAALKKLEVRSDKIRLASVCGWIREHQNDLLREDSLAFNLDHRMPTIGEKAEKLFRSIALVFPAGSRFEFDQIASEDFFVHIQSIPNPGPISLLPDQERDLKLSLFLMGISFSRDFQELGYLIRDYLVGEKNLLISNQQGFFFKVSPKGWAYFESGGSSHNSDLAFVAMWFSEETNSLWHEGIYPGVLAAGYKPFRIDKHDHNNRIDDEIIASIKRSKFLVADFTGQRGGVYFEAGFSLGLGQQVVWLCRKSDLDSVHFDNRQYNFIVWDDGKWRDLARALTLRIEATVGHGTFRNNS
jgi:hypothetical protein